MTTALIADDEPHLARALAAECTATLKPDIAFLDIQMPGLTGRELAQGIEGGARVVFVTACDDYAVPAFEHEALDHVQKLVKTERLQRTVQRVRRALAQPAADDGALLAALKRLVPPATAERLRWVRASSGELTQQLAVQDVLFFRADDKYTGVQTAGAEHLVRTPIALRMKGFDSELPVSRTYVNLFKAM